MLASRMLPRDRSQDFSSNCGPHWKALVKNCRESGRIHIAGRSQLVERAGPTTRNFCAKIAGGLYVRFPPEHHGETLSARQGN